MPGLEIGPKCAADRGLVRAQAVRGTAIVPRQRRAAPTGQLDWINDLTTGEAGKGMEP